MVGAGGAGWEQMHTTPAGSCMSKRVVAWPGGQGLADVPRGWPAGDTGSGDACVVGRGCAWQGGVSILQSSREIDGGVWPVEPPAAG